MQLRIKPNKIDTYFPGLSIGVLLQTLLKNLNLSEADAEMFLTSADLELEDPMKIYGMRQAVNVIEEAIQKKQKVAIHGDFDVDGTSATAILWDYLYYERGIEVLPIIPHRVDEGYGLSIKTIEKALAWGANLIITVDCGIKDAAIVDDYKAKVDFVITDHHQFATNDDGSIVLPDAKAVVHSAHPKSKYSTMISGGATSWQLVRALETSRQAAEVEKYDDTKVDTTALGHLRSILSKDDVRQKTEKYLDLVALTTVCDIIPLTLENRKLIQKGLKKTPENNHIGLTELLKQCSVDPNTVSAYHFGFVLGPRLNAPGRVTNDAMDAVRLLSTRNQVQAEHLAQKLCELNVKRQSLTAHYLEIAEKQIDPSKKAIVVLGHEWPEGILGLIAGKLAEKHFKPTFVASVGEGGQIIGSSRSPLDTFYLSKSLEHAKDHLTRFGGHKQAAGFASTEEKFSGFEEKVIEYITQNTTDADFERILDIDLELESLQNISIKDIEELTKLEPHGAGNPRPLFILKSCTLKDYSYLGKDGSHLKLLLKLDGQEIEAIAFGAASRYPDLAAGQTIDVIGHLGINEWNNRKKIQIELKHLIPAQD
jgi:single-stranded-DNA-specific exonuclease